MRLLRLKTVTEAIRIIQDSFSSLPAETLPLEDAFGRYLAKDITSGEDVPGFDRSIVDGFAVSSRETFGVQEGLPALLDLTGEVKMGAQAATIGPGQCCYVPTGGMLPRGADAVVMVEYTEVMDRIANIYRQVAPGENVILRGEDIKSGQVLFEPGRKLRAPELGVLASLGIHEVETTRRPIVGIFSTGDEIVPRQTSSLRSGQVRDSISIALSCLIRQAGGVVITGGIVPDSYDLLLAAVEGMLTKADMVILSGGSSMGDKDYVPDVLRKLGNHEELLIEGVAVKPGKPTLLAACKGKPVLGLPGHPVSSLNIFWLLGVPLLRRLAGASEDHWLPTVKARLSRNVPSHPGRTDLVRVRVEGNDGTPAAVPMFGRSGLLRTLAEAEGLIVVDEAVEGISGGALVDVHIWS